MFSIKIEEKQFHEFMAAIDTLNSNLAAQTTAITALTAVVATAIPDINPLPGSGATEAQVAAVATTVATNTAAVQAAATALTNAVTPPPPVVLPVATAPSA